MQIELKFTKSSQQRLILIFEEYELENDSATDTIALFLNTLGFYPEALPLSGKQA